MLLRSVDNPGDFLVTKEGAHVQYGHSGQGCLSVTKEGAHVWYGHSEQKCLSVTKEGHMCDTGTLDKEMLHVQAG